MSEIETELLEAVRRVVAAFESLNVIYFVGGSMASSVMGEPRQTLDADLVARLQPAHAEPLVHQLGNAYYADLPVIQMAIQSQGSFNLIHLESMVKVDIFVAQEHPFACSQFDRRQKLSLGSTRPLEMYFASAEDTILAKLEWYRAGDCASDRQWRDILGVLKVQRESLDHNYLRNWATNLGLAQLLERAVGDAGL